MPPRYAYWTIIVGGKPTAFRAQQRDDLLPTFNQIHSKHPDAVMMWFARGRLWTSPEDARAAEHRGGTRRAPDWRPGGEHRDPRARFDIPRDEKRRRFAANLRRRRQEGEGSETERGGTPKPKWSGPPKPKWNGPPKAGAPRHGKGPFGREGPPGPREPENRDRPRERDGGKGRPPATGSRPDRSDRFSRPPGDRPQSKSRPTVRPRGPARPGNPARDRRNRGGGRGPGGRGGGGGGQSR
jgi:hypothetical protein